jgi:hypothetical protein
MQPNLTVEGLRELFVYCPETGQFKVKAPRRWVRKPVGSVIGSIGANGYIVIRIYGQLYRAHRLAWFYTHGCWPAEHIDHINGDRSDNRLANLREASVSQNLGNAKRSKNNTSGFKGVCRGRGDKWRATICVNGKRRKIGSFSTPEEAHKAYCAAATEKRGEFANFG